MDDDTELCIKFQLDRFGKLNVVPNSDLSRLRFFVCFICMIIQHSLFNEMEILRTKRFIPKGFELGTTLSLLRSLSLSYAWNEAGRRIPRRLQMFTVRSSNKVEVIYRPIILLLSKVFERTKIMNK